jgi:hypothetical protein
LTPHRRYDCAIDANDAEEVYLEQFLELLDSVSFGDTQRANPSVIYYDIDMPQGAENLPDSLLDRCVLSNIQVNHVERQTLPACERS